MKPDEIIDYAMPLMRIEKYAKSIHDAALHNQLVEAHELTFVLGAEVRILQRTLELMLERNNGK